MLCDMHNDAINKGDLISANKHYYKAEGFLDCYHAIGGNVGSLMMRADRYVSEKFCVPVVTCGGLLIVAVKQDSACPDRQQRSVAEPDAEGRALCQSGPRAVEADDRNGVQDNPAAPTI